MAGYGRREASGWDVALQGMNFLTNSMRVGQAIGEQRYQNDEREGINQALEHIAGKLGNQGDISVLDGDPILNTRHGTMAMGQFMQQRANTETSRLQMLKTMEAADDQFYQKTFRPMAFAAQEAFKSGDMQRFGSIASELSAKAPLPYRLVPGQDGNFDVEFRSDKAGGWTGTGRRLTPQQAMDEIGNIIGGEQRILSGANMQERIVNPRYLAAAARYKMGTIQGNAQALADPKQWIPLTRNGHTVYAIPQNRHDDYSASPSFRVLDEKGGTSTMMGSMEEVLSQGYVRADVKADIQNKQRIAAGRGAGGVGAGGGLGGMSFKVSDADNKWIEGQATTKDEFGNETTNPAIGMALLMLMGQHGQSRYSALQAYQNGVNSIMEQLHRENPNISPNQAKNIAQQYYCDKLMGRGITQGASQTTPQGAPPAAGSPQPAAEKAPLQKTLQSVAAGNVATGKPPVSESQALSPQEAHEKMVNGFVEGVKGVPGALQSGWNWYWKGTEGNAE